MESRKDKAMINKTWQGYTISKRCGNEPFPVYVKSIYRGKITWTVDYTYAKHYTETAAKRIDAEIDEGIRNGEFAGKCLIADSEVQEVVEEQQPETEVRTKEFFWNDEVEDIDKAMNHMLDCIARYTGSEDENGQDALKYFKSEYIRLAEVRAEAAKEWLAVW